VPAAPVLWHIPFSNYNEKARWALDYKGIAHRRRVAPPAMHPVWARRLAGTRTFPVLVVDGRGIGDSTAIVAELERRKPEPALYPGDPAERARALALEDAYDEELGADVRRVAMDAVRRDPDVAAQAMAPRARGARRRALKLAIVPLSVGVRRYYDVDPATVARAWERIDAALGRFRADLRPSGYLAGDRFSVADLTFAALVGAAIAPAGYPDADARALPELRSLVAERGVLDWIEEMYARHRGIWARAS
jgi:glutathione S-transferase